MQGWTKVVYHEVRNQGPNIEHCLIDVEPGTFRASSLPSGSRPGNVSGRHARIFGQLANALLFCRKPFHLLPNFRGVPVLHLFYSRLTKHLHMAAGMPTVVPCILFRTCRLHLCITVSKQNKEKVNAESSHHSRAPYSGRRGATGRRRGGCQRRHRGWAQCFRRSSSRQPESWTICDRTIGLCQAQNRNACSCRKLVIQHAFIYWQ